jgi:hypothetical protein
VLIPVEERATSMSLLTFVAVVLALGWKLWQAVVEVTGDQQGSRFAALTISAR